MHPAPLLAGGGEHLPQRGPEPERAVADGQYRGAHAAPPALAQQVGPGLGRFPIAVDHGDQLLAPVGTHADDDQRAQPGLVQPHREVHPVDPDIHIVHIG